MHRTVLILNALKNIANRKSSGILSFQQTVPPDFFTTAFILHQIMKYGDISLAVAMSNANAKFIMPVMPDGEKASAKEFQNWKKEFDSAAVKYKSKTTII